jgi:hypothetical protein
MWWGSVALMAMVAAGCTRPNLLYAPRVADGGRPDQATMETGAEIPAAETAPDGMVPADSGPAADSADDLLTVEASPADSTEAPPAGSDAVEVAPVADARDTSPPVDVSPPSSLVGYWKLNDMGGTQAKDSSPSGYHGSLEGITGTNWDFTTRGGGLRFDRGQGDGVRVGEVNAVLPKIQTLTQFTIAAWTFRALGSTGFHQSILSQQLMGNTEVFNLTFDNEFVKFYIYPQMAGVTVEAVAELTTGRAGGDWVHVAATYNGAFMRVYLDGVEAPGAVPYTGRLRPSRFPLFIGTNKNDPAGHQPFDGILDEVMLFSEALDGPAIQRLRDGELANL